MATTDQVTIMAANRDQERDKLSYNPCLLWSSFCSWYVRLLARFFAWFGQGIAKHPLLTIHICIALVSTCSVGFVWFKVENRTQKLFIPQQSTAIDDLNAAETFFRLKSREEIVLLVSSSTDLNLFSPKCLLQALMVHDKVIQLDSYSDVCVTLSGEKADSHESCMMVNPLEVFDFNQSNIQDKDLSQIQFEVNSAYQNPYPLMRNGRHFRYNFNRMFGQVTRNNSNNEILNSKALQLVYFIRDPSEEEASEKVLEWEKSFIDKMTSLEKELSCFQLYYSSERSLDDAIAESSGSDVTLVSITFTVMISFACFMLGKFLNPLTGHSLLANAGVFAVALGILAGFGLAMWCRVPFVSMVGVLPFLVLGIGIDDMFILVDELDRQPRQMTVTETVKMVTSRSGSTVTMTTMTDLVAFAVSTSTSFPAIRYFCVYAALTVTLSFLMIVTYFVAIMTYDIKRIKAGRRDCLPFCRAPQPKNGALSWDEPHLQTSNRVMQAWGKFLTLPVTKVIVILLSLAFLGGGIYGVTKVDETFDRRVLAKDDSYLKRFLSAQEKYFELSIEVNIVVRGNIDYEKQETQDAVKKLSKIVASNKHYRDFTLSWMDEFSKYAENNNKTITGPAFLPELQGFLNDSRYFKQDVKFSQDYSRVEASRILGFMKSSSSSTFQKNAMLSLREDLAKKSTLDVFPITRPFIFFEQYAITSRETIRNLLIAAFAVLIVTSSFLVDCTVAILVVLNFAALVCELFGLMVLWDVSLNSVSMINLVMAIGFAVDYSAHIAHAYVMSEKRTANERVVDALTTLGASVFLGGVSTFLGMVVLAFAASEIFRIFFRMFFGIVVFGLIHGLCILPVYLSLFRWRPAVTRPSSGRISVESRRPSEDNRDDLVDGRGLYSETSAEYNEAFELSDKPNEGKDIVAPDSNVTMTTGTVNEAFKPDQEENAESSENEKTAAKDDSSKGGHEDRAENVAKKNDTTNRTETTLLEYANNEKEGDIQVEEKLQAETETQSETCEPITRKGTKPSEDDDTEEKNIQQCAHAQSELSSDSTVKHRDKSGAEGKPTQQKPVIIIKKQSTGIDSSHTFIGNWSSDR